MNKIKFMDPFTRHYGMWDRSQQQRLARSCVAIGGVGGIGSPLALFLAKAGLGRIRIGDRDNYEIENIVEQAFATWDVIGCSKVKVAEKEMMRHQKELGVEAIHGDLAIPEIADQLVGNSKLVFSGVDNPAARISLGRAAVEHAVPFVVGANVGWSYFHTIYLPERGGYAAAFSSKEGIHTDELGFPVMSDPNTRSLIERDWCIWTVAFSGFRKNELRRFIKGDLSHFAYSAGPAFAAASATVMDGLKYLLGIGSVVTYPDVRVVDQCRGGQLSSAAIRRRFAAVAHAWDKGETAILKALDDND